MWHEKLVNNMEQLRPGSRGVLQALARHVDNEEDAYIYIYEWIIDEPEYLQMGDAEKAEAQMKRINEDLYVIMLDKSESESEALTRVRACPVGEGMQAYRAEHKRFMGVSGQAISEKIRKLMAPTTPKTEQDIADHLDKWIESIRTLENMRSEYKLQDPFKIIALEQIMAVGQAKLYFENIKINGGGFDQMLVKCREYATRRRIEHGHKKNKDDMDVDGLD